MKRMREEKKPVDLCENLRVEWDLWLLSLFLLLSLPAHYTTVPLLLFRNNVVSIKPFGYCKCNVQLNEKITRENTSQKNNNVVVAFRFFFYVVRSFRCHILHWKWDMSVRCSVRAIERKCLKTKHHFHRICFLRAKLCDTLVSDVFFVLVIIMDL